MNLLNEAPLWAKLLLGALLLIAAIDDARRRRIANILSLAVALAAVAVMIMLGPTIALWQNGAVFAVLLGVGLPLFAAGWLGGGDVKLFAAVGLWSNFGALLPLLAAILLTGGVLAVGALLLRPRRVNKASRGLPYGIAIAAGTAMILAAPYLERRPATPLDLPLAPPGLS